MKRKYYTFILILCFFIGMSACVQKEQTIELDFSSNTLEYGEKVDFNKLLKTEGYTITENNYDSMTLGEQKVSFTVVDEDKKESEATYTFTVEDTKGPEIVLKEETVTIEYGTDFDSKSNVESCTDPVDGEIEFAAKGKVDTSKAGEYVVVVKAEDKNGNESSVEYKVVVKEKTEDKKQASNSGASNGSSSNSNSQQGSGSSNQSTPANGSSSSSSSNNGGGSSSDSSSSSTPSYVAPAEGYKYDYAMQVFNLINQERMARGLSYLPWNQQLHDEISSKRSIQIITNPGHDGLYEMLGIGCEWNGGRVSETVSMRWSDDDPSSVVTGLLNSSAHYDILMDTYSPSFSMAVSTYYQNYRWYTCVNLTY